MATHETSPGTWDSCKRRIHFVSSISWIPERHSFYSGVYFAHHWYLQEVLSCHVVHAWLSWMSSQLQGVWLVLYAIPHCDEDVCFPVTVHWGILYHNTFRVVPTEWQWNHDGSCNNLTFKVWPICMDTLFQGWFCFNDNLLLFCVVRYRGFQ